MPIYVNRLIEGCEVRRFWATVIKIFNEPHKRRESMLLHELPVKTILVV